MLLLLIIRISRLSDRCYMTIYINITLGNFVKILLVAPKVFREKDLKKHDSKWCMLKSEWRECFFSKMDPQNSNFCNFFYELTHFSPVPHFYTPWKHQKTFGFLTFSGGIEMWHWTKMVNQIIISVSTARFCFSIPFIRLYSTFLKVLKYSYR